MARRPLTSDRSLRLQIPVKRYGDVSGRAAVNYATSDNTANQKKDYTASSGTLVFAPGEAVKTFTVLITDNAYVDGERRVDFTLSNSVGAALDIPSGLLLIEDNDTAAPTTNPIDEARFFVRQHYLDFLNREPDAGGWDYWTNAITSCPGGDAKCINSRRVSVSAAFFIEQEFQLTGNYVYRMYKATYGQLPTFAQFIPDRARINPAANQSVICGVTRTQTAISSGWMC